MTGDTIEKHKTRRAVASEQLLRLKKFAISKLEMACTAEIELRLTSVDQVYSTLCESQSMLEQLDPLKEVDSNARAEFEDTYFFIKPALLVALDKRKLNSKPEHSASVDNDLQVKLPRLELKSFSGDYTKWPEFYESFKKLVHENKSLNNIARFQYLRNSLSDSAARTIDSIELTSDNYEEALKILFTRYSNKKIICQEHFRKLFSIKPIDRPSAHKLRELTDEFTSHLRALTTLGRPTAQWDDLIVFLMCSKLDHETRTKWDDESNYDRLDTLDELLKFLNRRCHFLEAMPVQKSTSKISNSPIPSKSNSCQSSFVSTKTDSHCHNCNGTHLTAKCRKFLKLSYPERLQRVIQMKLCQNCLRADHSLQDCKSTFNCRRCHNRHHTYIHQENPSGVIAASQSIPNFQNVSTAPVPGTSTSSNAFIASNNISSYHSAADVTSISQPYYVLLGTAIVQLFDKNGRPIYCRALLDSASMSNFITEKLSNRLDLKRHNANTSISGIGGRVSTATTSRCSVNLKSCITAFTTTLNVEILPIITKNLPHVRINISNWPIPKNINLADPEFFLSKSIDLLIGVDTYYNLLSVGQIQMDQKLPILQNTVLGWIVAGKIQAQSYGVQRSVCNLSTVSADDDLHLQIQRFWQIEDIDAPPAKSEDELLCEAHFQETYKRHSSGRYEVRLPFREPPSCLGKSNQMAAMRFLNVEKRLLKNPELRDPYFKFIAEYKELDHMRLVPKNELRDPHFYLPHHCVLKPDSSSTKLRVVFDGSAKTDNGRSLNGILRVGGVVQPDLFSILIRFRTHTYCFSADISKMYRQIQMNEDDSHMQYIFWRNNPGEELATYRLTTVTYGISSASYHATRTVSKQLADDEEHNFPSGSKILRTDVYVDDILSGANTLEEARMYKSELIGILGSAGMDLRKWCSNDLSLLSDIPKEHQEPMLQLENTTIVKTLGMLWDPNLDVFRFHVVRPEEKSRITKRTSFSDISRLFDPMGLAGPVVTLAKVFMQQLWQLKLDWDQSLPQLLHSKWMRFRHELYDLNKLSIKRHITSRNTCTTLQLHGFADASERAYGAAVYLRSIDVHHNITVSLICSKSRVAPLHKISVARLELCAAQILSQLLHRIIPVLQISIDKVFCWSDSKIALAWISKDSSNWQTFVANRVSEIQKLTNGFEWNYVDTKSNPADVISRGILPSKLLESTLWYFGPEFLSSDETSWSIDSLPATSDIPEQKVIKCVLATTVNPIEDLVSRIKFSNSFTSLQRVMAYVCRYIAILRGLATNRRTNSVPRISLQINTNIEEVPELSLAEIDTGLSAIIKNVQLNEFTDEMTQLAENQPIARNSRINTLNPFLDDNKILRVGGRLSKSNLPFSAKYPILLPSQHPFTLTLFKYFHRKLLHMGPQGLLAAIRQNYWPLRGRELAAKTYQRCLICFRSRPKDVHQLMGDLPTSRVQYTPPFTNVGVDYCGPFYIHHKIRGKAPTKVYISLFICFAVKAIHLEVVSDLTTNAFIGALKRFVATRGKCSHLYSDNATNFIGASHELHKLYTLFHSANHQKEVRELCIADHIHWHFAPPRSPNFGGIYEASIKLTKFHLQRVMGNATLTYDELLTVTKQAESAVNSRPITPLSSSPDDLEALTPGHFLIGRPLTAILEPDIRNERIPTLRRWSYVQQLNQHFWHRWSAEYLQGLQHRRTWNTVQKNIAVGELVILKDDNLPPLKWRLGRVLETHPGTDGKVRVVTVKTQTGIFKRAITKVCPLPLTNDVES